MKHELRDVIQDETVFTPSVHHIPTIEFHGRKLEISALGYRCADCRRKVFSVPTVCSCTPGSFYKNNHYPSHPFQKDTRRRHDPRLKGRF